MRIEVTTKQTVVVPGRAGMCCGSCCAPVGVN
ncbi:methanobactin [Plasticicumulans acidivorans]|uniref:Mb-OB3b family methanobactin n=1 Tax=Plasticicumulans acidivorans TaxID=886464 RepID=A0A317N4H2_9GAMM|nr:methanobactin [Plasticicumulans acidivorans]PWV65659.1 Mb-OB3b family methanobactin precursor [Plasticicumulans acidivorans]